MESPDHELPDTVAAALPDGEAADAGQLAALTRRVNLLVGALAGVLILGLVALLLNMNRVSDAERDASIARSELASIQSQLATAEEDLARVEAGAALYASQITGFQELVSDLGPEVSGGIDEAIAGLRDFGESTIAFDVNIDEVIPVDTEVVIARTVEVPINTSIPITETFDTTIEIDTPLGALPLDVSVPVDIDVPVDLVVNIPIDETVPIQDEFPVQLDVPIAIEVRETELAELTDSLAAGLESLREVLNGLSG